MIIPLALAVLVSFLLARPVRWAERLKLAHSASVVLVLTIAFSLAGTMIWIGASQLADIIIRLPQYQQNIEKKLHGVRNPAGSVFARAAESINEIAADLSPANTSTQADAAATGKGGPTPNPATTPVPVKVVKETGPFSSLGVIGSSVATVLATIAAVVILTLFMLLRSSDLRNRLFRLFGKGQINAMTTAMDDAAERVSSYLLTESVVNCTFGLLLGIALFFIGVPFAAFWGVFGAILRFIPYVGTWTAGLCPFILSLAVFDGWARPLLVLGVFAAIELSISGIVEPLLYSTRTGISSLAILISAAFWTMLWGPIGLIVSTPLTVLLFVLGRHVPQLEYLYIVLGDEPVLPPEAWYYQRLLAMDEDEARQVVDEYLKQHTLPELYDAVLIPALALAEQDRHGHELDEEREKYIYDTTRDLIEELGENAFPDLPMPQQTSVSSSISILCVPARDEADELVAAMLVQSLRIAGYTVEAASLGFMDEMMKKVAECGPDVLFISALPPFAVSHARSLCRKARKKCPGMKSIVGLWEARGDLKTADQRIGPACNYVVHNIAEAELQLRLIAGESQPQSADSFAPQTENAPQAVESA